MIFQFKIMIALFTRSFKVGPIVLWNTDQMQKVYEILDKKGFKVDPEDMARVPPLSTKNVLVHGQYSF